MLGGNTPQVNGRDHIVQSANYNYYSSIRVVSIDEVKIELLKDYHNLFLLIGYFWNKLPRQIKNGNSIKKFKIKSDDFRNDGKKNKLRGYFLGTIE